MLIHNHSIMILQIMLNILQKLQNIIVPKMIEEYIFKCKTNRYSPFQLEFRYFFHTMRFKYET